MIRFYDNDSLIDKDFYRVETQISIPHKYNKTIRKGTYIHCECGKIIKNTGLSVHKTTIVHNKYLKWKTENDL